MLAVKVENLSKAYQLGEIGTGTLSRDLERWFAKVRGKDDPFLTIGETNDRTSTGESNIVWSLKDINFEIEEGDTVGIIGSNGAGKSTLLKLLSRITSPSIGEINVKGRIASLLEVGTGFHPELTGRENIYLNGAILGMRKKEIKRKFDEIVDFAGVERYIDTPVKRYSSGMYVRLAFAVAAHLESEILIVDEVLAVGDAEFQKKCIGKMGDVSRNDGRTVLFVSHNMASIKELCKRSILLSKGTVSLIGNTQIVVDEYLNNTNLATELYFGKSLQYVSVQQINDTIEVIAEFEYFEGLRYPHLGIVFKNMEGVPLFGTNPSIENTLLKLRNDKGGKIIATIREPKLQDGNYLISIWFGNRGDDIITAVDCLKLKVEGMTGNQQINPSIVGNISVKSEWQLLENL